MPKEIDVGDQSESRNLGASRRGTTIRIELDGVRFCGRGRVVGLEVTGAGASAVRDDRGEVLSGSEPVSVLSHFELSGGEVGISDAAARVR